MARRKRRTRGKPGEEPVRWGRPPKVNFDEVKKLLGLAPTLEACAAYFDVSISAIEECIKRETALTFRELRHQCAEGTKAYLVTLAIEKAHKSDALHIFALKNLCGWRDRHEVMAPVAGNGVVSIALSYNPAEPLPVGGKTIPATIDVERSHDDETEE